MKLRRIAWIVGLLILLWPSVSFYGEKVKDVVVPYAMAQTSCSSISETTLLNEFADNQAAGSIVPAYVRNLICSIGNLIPNSGVSAGTYSNASFTVNAQGIITAASSGSPGSGTVTSVGATFPGIFTCSGSPITSFGTIACSYTNQSENTFLGGPSSGSPTAPTFRALATADMPAAVALTTNVNSWSATQSNGVVTLTPGSTITPAFGTSSGNVFLVQLTGNVTTFKNPTGTLTGSCGILEIQQPASGGPYTISAWGSAWYFPGGVAPVLSTGASDIDAFSFCGISSSIILASPLLNAFANP